VLGAGPPQDRLEGEAPVDGRSVGHHRLRRHRAKLREVLEGAAHEPRAGCPALVGMLLDVGVAGVVVDRDVQIDPAAAAKAAGLGRAPADPMPRAAEGRQLGGVDVKQRTRP